MTTPIPIETQLLLNAFVDGELDAASSLAVERRLDEDPDLGRLQGEILALRTRLRQDLPREVASDRLRLAMSRIGALEPMTLRLPSPRSASPAWRLALAACVVGMIAGAGVTALLEPSVSQAPAMAEVVSDHLRAVMAPQPFDVASSDQHSVKPWFTGRLSFAPQVFDLTPEGFTLLGGRVDVLNGQPAAALVFRHGKHVISLLSQPVGPLAASAAGGPSQRGFQLREWTLGAMNYWAVSDVASEELDAFEAAVRIQLAKGG